MRAFQYYVLRQILAPLFAILAALIAIAILTQGLGQLDLIVNQRGSGFAFLWVTILALPQLLSLILPLALFFAVAYAINRLHTDSELVVAFAAGVSQWQIIAPVFRLATVAALAQLVVGVLVQPASYREMRETVYAIRGDLAASMVREGAFTTPADGLTLYTRASEGGEMLDVMVHDSRNPKRPVTYTARRGATAMVEGRPAIIMHDGQIQQPKPDGAVDLLDFDQYVLELGEFIGEQDALVLKASDRYLSELFAPNRAHYYDQGNVGRFLAEGHSRIASPLLNIAFAMIALAALVGGDFNRRGYGARMAQAAVLALTLRLVALAIQAAARDEPALNIVQYALPIAVTAAAIWVTAANRRPRPRRARATMRNEYAPV